jgi:hypothetical protein
MNYKTFKKWVEMKIASSTTGKNPIGSVGGPNPIEDTKKELANKVGPAAKSGQDPKKVAQGIIDAQLKKAGANKMTDIKDVATLASAIKSVSGNMKK